MLPHLVVPKFMRHRFAHEWGSTSSWRPMHYIDQASDYPQRVREKLRARLFASCFGEKVVHSVTRRLGMKHFPVRPDSMTDHYPETFDVPIEMVDALVRAHLLGAE